MNVFFRIGEYLKYAFRSKSKFSIHSPFAYDFYINVFDKKKKLPETYRQILQVRKQLLKSKESIQVTDLGTGRTTRHDKRKISDIVRRQGSNRKKLRVLFRMIEYLKSSVILEVGTSLGLGTLSLALANPTAKVVSLEGCPQTAAYATKLFSFFKTHINIKQVIGDFDKTLPEVLKEIQKVNFVFFDGNHTYEATLRYFKWCLLYKEYESVFVFDDIYWSPDMKKAWNEILKHPEITLSMDFYYFGIVFFDKKTARQHYILKY